MEAEADKLVKQANKLSSPALLTLRLKGDWEQATPLYEKAAGLYRVRAACVFASVLCLRQSSKFSSRHKCVTV